MKLLRFLLSVIVVVFSAQSIRAQDNGTIFLSKEILEKNVYTFRVQEIPIELFHPQWFSTENWKYHPGDDKNLSALLHNKTNRTGNWVGLSMAYDIVKAHGGELKVETKDGEFSEFTIIL